MKIQSLLAPIAADVSPLRLSTEWAARNLKERKGQGSWLCVLCALLGLSTMTVITPRVSAQAVVEAWVQRYSHPADTDDHAKKVVTDNAGNVIVAGYTDDKISGANFLIIKYSGAGVPLWTNRYNGGSAHAVAVDGSGNVFVTGSSLGTTYPDYDYATIKFSGAGVPLWTNRYIGPGNGDDIANAIEVDDNGNVFVTGFSHGGSSSNDYATIKYSGAGAPLWTNRYNGSDNTDDRATASTADTITNADQRTYRLPMLS